MSLIEFIGFFISFLAMIVLFFRRTIERRRQQQNPELYEEMQQRKQARLSEFLRALDVQHGDAPQEEEDAEDEDEDEDVYVPPIPVRAPPPQAKFYSPTPAHKPQRLVQDGYQFHTKIEERSLPLANYGRLPPTSIGDNYKNRFATAEIVSPNLQGDPNADPYALAAAQAKNRADEILARLQSPRDMVILHEIIGPPKALR